MLPLYNLNSIQTVLYYNIHTSDLSLNNFQSQEKHEVVLPGNYDLRVAENPQRYIHRWIEI